MSTNGGKVGFTKGPWEVRDYDGELKICAPDIFSAGFRLEMRIASDIGGYRAKLEDGARDDFERQANARLIASAPDLLEALRVAVRQNSHDMLMTGDELRVCEAAIAIAEGEGQ